MKEGSRGSKEHGQLLGTAGSQGLAVRKRTGRSGRVGTGILWSTPGSDTPTAHDLGARRDLSRPE